MNVFTRSYNSSRTGANTSELRLNPVKGRLHVVVKSHSLVFDDDPRLEAQPLYAQHSP